jgi:hypothetical protein
MERRAVVMVLLDGPISASLRRDLTDSHTVASVRSSLTPHFRQRTIRPYSLMRTPCLSRQLDVAWSNYRT